MKKCWMIVMVLFLVLVFGNSLMAGEFCNLVGGVGNKIYLFNIDYQKNEVNFLREIVCTRNNLNVLFSADRNGNIIAFFGDEQNGWNEVAMYDNNGYFKKQLYKGAYQLSSPISDGNYIVYSELSGRGGVIKNGKVIRKFSKNCCYKGICGDEIYITTGNVIERNAPLYKINMISLETKIVMKSFDCDSDMEFFSDDSFMYCRNLFYGLISQVMRVEFTKGKYTYDSDMQKGDSCFRKICGYNSDYVFTTCGIASVKDYENIMSLKPEFPRILNLQTGESSVLISDSMIFDSLEDTGYTFDLL